MSNHNDVYWNIRAIIPEVLAIFTFRLFFLDYPEEGSSELFKNVLPICMA